MDVGLVRSIVRKMLSSSGIVGEEKALQTYNIPSGWLKEDGSSISRITYGLLFNALTFKIKMTNFQGDTSFITDSLYIDRINIGATIQDGSTFYTVTSIDYTTKTVGIDQILYAANSNKLVTCVPFGCVDTTHFNLPDARGRVSVGMDFTQAQFRNVGTSGGENAHTMTESELLPHKHQYKYPVTKVVGSEGGVVGSENAAGDGQLTWDTTVKGGGLPFNILQPYNTVIKIIKY